MRAGEGRASLRASRRGLEKARTEPRPPNMAQVLGREGEPPCEPGKGGRASVRAGGDWRRLGRSLALPTWLKFWEGRASLRASRRREGEPPCEPAGIGEGSDGASPSQHGSSSGKGGRASVRAGEGRASLRASRRREGEPPCEPAGIGEGSDGASPSHNGSIPTTRGITAR